MTLPRLPAAVWSSALSLALLGCGGREPEAADAPGDPIEHADHEMDSGVTLSGDSAIAPAWTESAACPARARGCQPAIGFALGPLYFVEPAPVTDLVTPLTLQVIERAPIMRNRSGGAPHTNDLVLRVSSKAGSTDREQLILSASAPWALRSEAIPDLVVFDRFAALGGCARKGVSGLGGNSLRDAQGALLSLRSGFWLRPNGAVEIPGHPDLPFSLRWVDVGCGRCSGDRSTVAIELTLQGASTPVGSVLPGEALSLTLNGADYVLRVGLPSFDYAAQCGESGFSVYREDLVIALNEDGTTRQLDPTALWSTSPH